MLKDLHALDELIAAGPSVGVRPAYLDRLRVIARELRAQWTAIEQLVTAHEREVRLIRQQHDDLTVEIAALQQSVERLRARGPDDA